MYSEPIFFSNKLLLSYHRYNKVQEGNGRVKDFEHYKYHQEYKESIIKGAG